MGVITRVTHDVDEQQKIMTINVRTRLISKSISRKRAAAQASVWAGVKPRVLLAAAGEDIPWTDAGGVKFSSKQLNGNNTMSGYLFTWEVPL